MIFRINTNLFLGFVSPCIITQFNQLDATIPQVYYLTFMYSSTCFGPSVWNNSAQTERVFMTCGIRVFFEGQSRKFNV